MVIIFKNIFYIKKIYHFIFKKAPEIINNENRKYNEKVDVWSCGVILYEILSKKLPFPFDMKDDKDQIEKDILCNVYNETIDKDTY